MLWTFTNLEVHNKENIGLFELRKQIKTLLICIANDHTNRSRLFGKWYFANSLSSRVTDIKRLVTKSSDQKILQSLFDIEGYIIMKYFQNLRIL